MQAKRWTASMRLGVGLALLAAGAVVAPPASAGDAVPAPLQFEPVGCEGVDWGPHAARLKAAVRARWRIPEVAVRGEMGGVRLHFLVAPGGEVEDPVVLRRTGPRSLARAARRALRDASPVEVLPEPCEALGVTWTFTYNMRDGDIRRWERANP